METSETVKPISQEQIISQQAGQIFLPDDLKKLTDFFSILMQIDQRAKVTKTYAKPNK